MGRKPFTVQGANALLPTLEAALDRIAGAAAEARERHDKLQVLDALWGEQVHEPANPDHQEWRSLRASLALAVDLMEREIDTEITGRGIRFPWGGLQHGLLDFPTTWEGRWVYLCWHRGEQRITAWHEVVDGFAGRQPLTDEQARSMGRDTGVIPDDDMLDF